MSMESEKPKFDLNVHIRDRKSGQIVKKQPYKLRIENGRMKYIRDGIAYHPDGSQVDKNAKPVREKSLEEVKEELMLKGQKFDEVTKKLELERAELQERLKASEMKLANQGGAEAEAKAKAEKEAAEKAKLEAEQKAKEEAEAKAKAEAEAKAKSQQGKGKGNSKNESF